MSELTMSWNTFRSAASLGTWPSRSSARACHSPASLLARSTSRPARRSRSMTTAVSSFALSTSLSRLAISVLSAEWSAAARSRIISASRSLTCCSRCFLSSSNLCTRGSSSLTRKSASCAASFVAIPSSRRAKIFPWAASFSCINRSLSAAVSAAFFAASCCAFATWAIMSCMSLDRLACASRRCCDDFCTSWLLLSTST
mmetsp:Transcript_54230/g.123898  ORF Transcript_54230/g.123898 Transcript_54230/m.123898 type:complete len:200 (+) Transcript_54230:240-839(+)